MKTRVYKTLGSMLAVAAWMHAAPAAAQYTDDIRQALQGAVSDAQASLKEAVQSGKLPADRPLAVLPLWSDASDYVQGQLKIAAGAAGLNAVEGKDDPFWSEVLKEVEWATRKSDMLDPATLTAFGKLQNSKLLMYGGLRQAGLTGRKVYVELELHVSSIETKQHLWGGLFAKRFYLPGEVTGVVALDDTVREVLGKCLAAGAVSVSGAGDKLATVRTVAIVPLAGDLDNYVTQRATDMLTQTRLFPKNLDVRTLFEARQILRDQPQQADAVMYGALRDLSRRLDVDEPLRKVYEVTAEVQLAIQSAATGEVLWSATLSEKALDEEKTGPLEAVWKLVRDNPKAVTFAVAGFVVVLFVLGILRGAVRRPPR